MGSLIEQVVNGTIMSIATHLIWINFCNINLKKSFCKIIISIVLFMVVLVLNYSFTHNYLRLLVCTFACFILLYIFINKKIKESLILSVLTESVFIVSEFLFSIVMLIIFKNNLELAMHYHFGSLLTNLCISVIGIMIFRLPLINKIYIFLLDTTSKLKVNNVIFVVLILIISLNLILATQYYKISSLSIIVINAALLFVYSIILLNYIREKNRYIGISDKYSLTESSLKELQNNINRLKTVNHENKNQLLTIRAMIANKDKNVLKNIDAIIEQKIKDDKELQVKISVLANTMIGSLIYTKLLTMRDIKIKYNIHVDNEINKVEILALGDKTNIDICKAIGVYLDNAIEATMETDNKEICIDVYKENKDFCITISNTFTGNIEMDKISDYGYTTKSEGHGYGLSLVKEVINSNSLINSETEIIDNVFMQKLIIKM